MAYYDDIKDKKAPFESHYISAYGLAVKHGFTGSEEEWLESLSDYGIAKKHGFTGSEEEWNDAVNASREAAEAAKTGAEAAKASAQEYAESARKVAEDLEKSYNPHLLDKNNPHGVTASQVGAYTKEKVDELLSGKSDSRHTHKESDNHLKNTDNPHKVTAEQLGAYPKDKLYTKEEVDELVNNVDVDLSDYVKNTDYATGSKGGVVKTSSYFGTLANADGYLYLMQATDAEIDAKEQRYHIITPNNLEYAVAKGGEGHFAKEDDVFETSFFGWTEFEYTADEEAFADIKDDSISAGSSYPITIHCKGKVIGFTASCNGMYYKLTVNGKNVLENTSWSNVAQTYTLHPTLMTEDIVVELSASQINFTDMTIQSIKGFSELESQIGDIDEALDRIIDIAEKLAPTATLG